MKRLYTFLAAVFFVGIVAGFFNPRIIQKTSAASNTVTLTPTADTYVDSANPSTNYGTDVTIRLRGANSPFRNGLIHFDLSSVPAGSTVTQASLTLSVSSDGSATGGTLSQVNGSWTETGVTYNTAPAVGAFITNLASPATPNTTTTTDVTAAVVGHSSVDWYMTTPSSDGVIYYSKEKSASLSPQLIVTYAAGATVTPTPVPTSIPTPTSAPTPTPTPIPSGTDPIIAAAGDIACGSSTSSGAPCQQLETANVIAQISPSAVLPLGDNQYEDGALADFQNYYNPTWGTYKPITDPAVGNHEYLTTNAQGYFDYFNGVGNQTGPAGDRSKGYYSYTIGAWHLIALNANCSHAGGCSAGSPQETWLKADLAANTGKCILAYDHFPMFSSGQQPHNSGVDSLFTDLYNAHADVFLVGHDHDYERFVPSNPQGQTDPNGVTEFVVGTGGRSHTQLSSGGLKSNSVVFDGTTFGVLKMTLHPTSYDWVFIPSTGGTYKNGTFTDSGTASCHL